MLSVLFACGLGLSACGGGDDTEDLVAAASADASSAALAAPAAKVAIVLPVPTLVTSTLAAVSGSGASTSAASSTSTTDGPLPSTPQLDAFEAVARDALGSTSAGTIVNHWGGHQPRVTVHNDGTVRMLYVVDDPTRGLSWRLMKRGAGSTGWSVEGSGATQDDVYLLRDPTTDAALVIAWPNSVPTVHATPGLAPQPLPGQWQTMAATSRHYSGAGMSADGTLCLKASVEKATPIPTSNTETTYLCGKLTAKADAPQWYAQQSRAIGDRHAYDYLFPTTYNGASWLAATAQRDLYKSAAGLPNLSANYVFNGVRGWGGAIDDATRWVQSDLVMPMATPANATTSPLQNQVDALLDSRSRMLTLHFADSDGDTAVRGFYLTVAGLDGRVLSSRRLDGVPTYGTLRLYEDARQRLWLVYANAGSTASQFWLLRLSELTGATGEPLFSVGEKVDFSQAVWPYSLIGAPLLAVQRGGNAAGMAIYGQFDACATTYESGAFNTVGCFGNNGQGAERVFHFRIRLPA